LQLGQDVLKTVVDQAIAWWAATGIDAAQVEGKGQASIKENKETDRHHSGIQAG